MLKSLFPVIKEAYKRADRRIIFMDYDGTLVPFANIPEQALPDRRIIRLVQDLASEQSNEIVIISGRDCKFLDAVFSEMKVILIAEHGGLIRKPGYAWKIEANLRNDWKRPVRRKMEKYCKMFSGSMVEEKLSSLAWHYRNSIIQPGAETIERLTTELSETLRKHNLEVFDGKCVLEVKEKTVNKGTAATSLLKESDHDFILAVGDDVTDEYLFKVLPDDAFSIKVGEGETFAKYCCMSIEDVVNLLAFIKN